MSSSNYKNALNRFSKLLSLELDSEKGFSELVSNLREFISFDYIALYYVNADRLNLKFDTSYVEKKIYDIPESYFDISKESKEIIFDSRLITFDMNSCVAKNLNLAKHSANFAMIQLAIRGTVFGFILLAKFGRKHFIQEELDILDSFAAVASYSIKDSELSNVFKMQLKVLQDNILEKTEAYKTIKEQNKKIVEADKAKNEFIANISHELRTPLNAIIGFSDVLQSKLFGELNEKQMEYIADINASGVHLLGMINEFLDLAKIEAKVLKLNKSDFELSRCINEVVNILRPLYSKKNITIEKRIEESLTINADFQKIQQILFNLLSNAIKFTPENGKIEIDLEQNATKTTIKVKDNGIGIDKKYQGKIFGKFVQLQSAYTKSESSTGLGLTITKELVELHGGKISLVSKINQGSTFIIELPL